MASKKPDGDLDTPTSSGNEMDTVAAVPPPARVSTGAHISSMEQVRARDLEPGVATAPRRRGAQNAPRSAGRAILRAPHVSESLSGVLLDRAAALCVRARASPLDDPPRCRSLAPCPSPRPLQYKEMYDRSIKQPDAFWADMARTHLSWFRDFTEV
jgi:hypothetical protein